MARFDLDHWDAYNERQTTREPRELCRRLLALTGPGEGRLAIDVGAGAGVETAALLAHGWHVLALEPAPGAARTLSRQVPPAHLPALEVRAAGLPTRLPPADVVHAAFTLPFVPPDRFTAAWESVRDALRPGARVAVTFFGPRDSWATDPDVADRLTFCDDGDLDALLDGLHVEHHDVREHDGPSFSGPKHWHTVEVIAQAPARGD